jgi:hypothetical protein
MHDTKFEQTWNLLKAKGLFPQFNTYQEYKADQKAHGIINLKEQKKVGMMNPELVKIKVAEQEFNQTK